MWLKRLPEPLQTNVRRIILKCKIPANQVLSFFNTWSRRWYRWKNSDTAPWRVVDFGLEPKEKVRSLCISLLHEERFQDRRELFEKQARKCGWRFDYWPAFDGTKFLKDGFPYWLKDRNKAEAKPFSAGAVGLLTTTREILQWAAELKLEYVVIFEDDAVIHAPPKFEVPEEFDIVFLNNRVQGDEQGRVKHGWGTDGYVISRSGVEKMLDILEHVTADIDMLIMMYTKSLEERDHYMTHYRDTSKPQLECYHVGPLVTHAGHFQSSIEVVSKKREPGGD